MTNSDENKRAVRDFVQSVWVDRNLAALGDFWMEDCVNHAMPGADNRGLETLRAYHEAFFDAFAAFLDIRIDVVQQAAEGDRIVMHIVMRGQRSGPFSGTPPTGKHVSMAAIRVDRLRDGKIAEHWSVSDLTGLMQQLQG